MNSKKKVRVAIFSGEIPSTTFIERLIEGVAENGLEVILFGNIKNRTSYRKKEIKVKGNKRGLFGLVQGALRVGCLFAFHPRRFFLVKNHFGYGPFTGKKEFLIWNKITPVLLNMPDIFHLQWAKSAEEWLFLKKLFDVKLILSLRGTHINSSPLVDAELASSYKRCFNQYDAFHAVSRDIAEKAVRYGLNIDNSRLILSGLPYQAFQEGSNKLQTPIKLLVVGRYHWKKGYNYLFDTLFQLRKEKVKFHLTLVSKGELPDELIYQIHELGLSTSITLVNGLSYASVKSHMRAHDLLLLPSVEEGIANVVLEAMQHGLPVVSTSCGGMTEVITNNQNGLIVPPGDSEAMVDAILYFISLSQESRDRLTRNAYRRIVTNHDLDKNIKEFTRLYERVLK